MGEVKELLFCCCGQKPCHSGADVGGKPFSNLSTKEWLHVWLGISACYKDSRVPSRLLPENTGQPCCIFPWITCSSSVPLPCCPSRMAPYRHATIMGDFELCGPGRPGTGCVAHLWVHCSSLTAMTRGLGTTDINWVNAPVQNTPILQGKFICPSWSSHFSPFRL